MGGLVIFLIIVLTVVVFHIAFWYQLDTSSDKYALQYKLLIGSAVGVVLATVGTMYLKDKMPENKFSDEDDKIVDAIVKKHTEPIPEPTPEPKSEPTPEPMREPKSEPNPEPKEYTGINEIGTVDLD